MAKLLGIYKCELCGNIVEVIHEAGGQLVCCGQAMKLYEENATDAAQEKHVPVVEKRDCCIKVTVGSVAHPMEEKHLIEWIELIADGRTCRKALKAGDAPEVKFYTTPETFTVRAYCNVHGLWKA